MKTGGRALGVGNKPKKIDVLQPLEHRRIHRGQFELESERDLYRLATGDRARLPREVMLSAMRYFEETAIEYMDVLKANMDAELEAIKANNPILIAQAAQGVAIAENRLREYISMAVDVGYKVAPYCHARLQAVLINAGDGEKPLNAIRQLFADIDEAGRPSRFIEHDANERVG